MTPNFFTDEQKIIESILYTIEEVLKIKGHFRLCLSGGTSILKTLKLFSTINIPWGKVVIYQTDERVVSLDSKDSNYYWIKAVLGNTDAMLKPFYNGCSKHESIEDYESYLKEDSNGEDPSFDLLLLGFGEDGHIASLFPNDEFAKSGDKVISVESKHNDYQRLSLGLSQLKRSSNTIIISYGEKKYNLLNKSQDLNLPIQQFIKDQVNVTWYHKE